MKILFIIIIFAHSLIHIAGFVRVFHLAGVQELKQKIIWIDGVLWLITAILFLLAATLLILGNYYWWLPSVLGIGFSQYLIFTCWRDARLGTILNVLILVVTIIGYGNWHFKHEFKKDVDEGLQNASYSNGLLTEADITNLPVPVQKYIEYAGCLGKSKVQNFRVTFKGQLRKSATSDWMPFTSEQFNFLKPATRLFFLKATMRNLPIRGYHHYKNGEAIMDIRLFSLFKVQYESGKKMDTSETVTFFNDMCVMAPATLIDRRIEWLETNNNRVKASFTNANITITAWLQFNDEGQLTNFISDDRYAILDGKMQKFQWSTPLKNYKDFNGYKLASYADAIYKYAEGDFTYGNFSVTNVKYNLK